MLIYQCFTLIYPVLVEIAAENAGERKKKSVP